MSLINEAILFAMEKHDGQLDDEGKDYFQAHLNKVARMIRMVGGSDDAISAALLHDTLEDTKTTEKELREKFNDKVADLVLECTHEGNKQDGFYFPRLKSKEAIMIKFADRLSNMSRMNAWDEERQAHFLKRSKFWRSEK